MPVLRLFANYACDIYIGWKGVPPTVRAEVWQLLVGYVPTNAARREAALARKRREYHDEAGTHSPLRLCIGF